MTKADRQKYERMKDKDQKKLQEGLRTEAGRLQETYPDSEVILLTPNYLGMFENGTEVHNGHVFKEFVDTVIVLGEELNLKCIDVFHESGIDGETGKVLLADWVHPSVYGRFEVGKLIAGYLCDWYPGEK